jgi:GTP diphosphokinase / guanosine-3',5'-bis(diphosphate) 3'-diphosphatase
VLMLSDLETGNRAARKTASRERLALAEGWVQTIKVADLISNTGSIVIHDPDFARVYLREKRLLIDVMVDADRRLRALALAQTIVQPTPSAP